MATGTILYALIRLDARALLGWTRLFRLQNMGEAATFSLDEIFQRLHETVFGIGFDWKRLRVFLNTLAAESDNAAISACLLACLLGLACPKPQTLNPKLPKP